MGPLEEPFFRARRPGPVDQVSCGECATTYDSDTNAFCPRCGSTDRAKTVPGALPVAARHNPRRRRVQASGVLLLVSGTLFLVSSLIGLAVPTEELARQFIEPMADQPGGTVILLPADDTPYDATLTTIAGDVVANATQHVGPFEARSPDHASLHVAWSVNGVEANATVIVLTGDTVRLQLAKANPGDVVIGSSLQTTVAVGRVVFVVAALLLVAGGLSALLLRWFPLAAAAAILGLVLGLVVVAGFLFAGLLFAIPFAVAALFILRGRRHFQRKANP